MQNVVSQGIPETLAALFSNFLPILKVPLLRSRVGLVVTIAQALRGHVRINLRGRQTPMPQQFLDAANVGTAIEHVCGEAMA